MYPRISVITIVKNGMPFFRETMESVLSQTYANVEYIVVDGNSNDGTLELIQSYGERLSKWVSGNDGGIADAFNAGFNLSTGDYILYLNADDALIHSRVLEEVARKIDELNQPDFIYGDCAVVDRQSSDFLYRASIDITLKKFLKGQIFPHPSTLTKRKYFIDYGLFDPNFRISMDYEFFLRGIKEVRIIHVPLLVTKVRNGGVSTVNQAQVVNEIISALRKNGYLGNRVDEVKLRFYFWIRRNMRTLLSITGLYGIFLRIRRKC
jgi:glycosyltransferase involved in cell wall biosynthesis